MIKKNCVSEVNYKGIKKKILNYIESKGVMQATILSKLENYLFDHLSLKETINYEKLLKILIKLILEKKIHIMIPIPFITIWYEKLKENFKYLKKGNYLIRENKNLGDIKFKNGIKNYLFDSRQKISNNHIELFFKLKKIINSHPMMRYFIIIQLKGNKIPIQIYNNLEFTFFNIDNKVKIPKKSRAKERDIEISLDEQRKNLNIVKRYRSNYMCFYITLIDSIHHYITFLQQNNLKNNSNPEKIKNMEIKYAYYCNKFTQSDWIDIEKGNPYRWESFFRNFNLPIKLKKARIESIKFHGKSFEANADIKFFIEMKCDERELINKLKKKGYKILKNNDKNKISIGLELKAYSICPSIEYYFFLFKYVIYYYLFQLFHYTCDYLMRENKELEFKESEKNIYKIFYPCLKELFSLQKGLLQDDLKFKFLTYNKSELEVLYNRFLMSEVFIIEKKLFKYFLLKSLKK